MRVHVCRFVCLLVIAITLHACGGSDSPPATTPEAAASAPATSPPPTTAFRLVAIDLGKALGADKRIAEPSTVFAPTDVVFAVVSTDGSGPSVRLRAAWTYPGGRLNVASERQIEPSGPTATEFRLSDPSGLPAGQYTLEIAANGQSLGVKQFTVE